jgi:hypothetical protein
LLCYRSKTRSSALSSIDCSLVDQQRVHPSAHLAHASDQELLLLPGKSDGLVWHSELCGFPDLELPYPASGRRVCNGRLLRKSPQSQNIQ